MTNPGGRPARYPLIADDLRRRIYDGTYRPYEKLPPIRALAEEFGVSQNTMRYAMEILKNEGLTYPNGLGTFVTAFAALGSEEMMDPRTILSTFGIPDDVAVDILNVHAHQLAEKQRAWLKFQDYGPDEEPCPCGGCSWCLAQDYIDHIDPLAEA